MALELDSLSGSLGAEVRGIDLTDLGDSDFTRVREAFLEHHVLLFRDQKLTPEQQIEFGTRWGELFVHPLIPHIEGHPELIGIINLGKKRNLTEIWHSDVSFAERPLLGAKNDGNDPPGPAARSPISSVPRSVPSLRHNSMPSSPSSAAKNKVRSTVPKEKKN